MVSANERVLRIALALCPALEPSVARKLVRRLGSAQAVWSADRADWRRVCKMREETAVRLDGWRHAFSDDLVEDHLAERGVHCLLPGDDDWPAALNDLDDAPHIVFLRGRRKSLGLAHHRVAVVGTRRASSYGLEATRWVTETLVQGGCDVVSGLALGIDAEAHRAALDAGGTTGAVLACGVDVCYPSSHQALYEKICEQGWVVSEYPPGSLVEKYRFPERNRLIAALAQAVIVVQAGERSGALRTVEAALDLGRDIYAVPGPITSVHFRGSHKLLQDGARILVDPLDVLTDWGLSCDAVDQRTVPARWRSMYDCLDGPVTATHLEHQLQASASEVFAGLLELELAGFIERVPGGLYQRCRHGH